MDQDALLADLDADQRRAVTTDSRLVAVIAGAGSGKTRVLTRRVAHRIGAGTAEGAHTVVLTFTREAAGELRRRLPRLGLEERITAGTFHSIAQGLLRQRWADTDQAPRSIVTDRSRIVRDVMGPEQLDLLVEAMNWATARGVAADTYEAAVRRGEHRPGVAAERVAEGLDRYRREKRRRGVIDLDDLLSLTIEALERDAEFAEGVRWRYRHVLVDEAQDLNPLQHRIVDLLRQGADDLFLVGDPAQAIYGFNGSDPTLLLDVSERFPGIEVVRLPVNHRSTPQIVEAGDHALRTGGQRSDVRSARPDGPIVTTREHADEHVEARDVASAVARLDPDLARAGRVAVLGRTHASLQPVRAALEAAGVAVRRAVDGAGSPLAPFLADAYRLRSAGDLRRWARDLFDVDEMPADSDDPRREVAEVATDFLREQPTGDGSAFRHWVATTDPFGGRLPGVDVLTFHGSKGREWRHVHLIGCETSLVPHRSATTVAAKAEETRLLYVAITRATDVLTVNWAQRRSGYARKLTPLLDGFESSEPDLAPPPAELLGRTRDSRSRTLERLRAWRATAARSGGTLPEHICTDRALSAIADAHPTSPDELDRVTGLGPITARRLFDGIAAALADESLTG
ncbi:MAG: UvrD-helicase domain-containing protein [Ilumatobacter sp.]|uniref:UvrD-helicase domain-containing protein n=1 Tax=Ilumatobacter sp. TaxID=1967498 RepID=UPI00261D560A|nr:UvrD-helicase domain-containing protein [Ilumatobacter sp.]MDJ0768894.1 UvrD-helicase domain-containing protein [Ilumatobacter sp.]